MPFRRSFSLRCPVVWKLGLCHYATILLLSGLTFGLAPSVAAWAQSTPIERPADASPFATHIAEAAQRFSIPASWISAVLRAESAGNSQALSPAGAMGLMQIMPATWNELSARHGLGDDPFDPRANILAGAAYLRAMHDRYGTVSAMLAAYNAGPGRYDTHQATGDPLPTETRAYVAALAPLLGGDALPDSTPVATNWRNAPLFVVHSGGRSSAIRVPAPLHPNDARNAQPDDLFITRHRTGDRP